MKPPRRIILAKSGSVYLAVRIADETTLRMGNREGALDLPLDKKEALAIAGKLAAWAKGAKR